MTDPNEVSPGSSMLLSQAERLARLGDCLRSAFAPNASAKEMPSVREMIQSLQAEAEILGNSNQARAFVQIALLTEVWECLTGDQIDAAGEIAQFCQDAIARFIECEYPASESGPGEVTAWVLEHSRERWGGYLMLFESDSPDNGGTDSFPPLEDPVPEDECSAIDHQALLRLFTGATADGRSTGVHPAVSPPAPRKVPGSSAPPTQEVGGSAVPEPTLETEFYSTVNVRATGNGHRAVKGHRGESRAMIPHEVPPAPKFRVPSLPSRLDLDDEIREAFLADASDLMERIQPLVLGLNDDQDQSKALHELGRCFHTLKGAAGSVGMSDLAALVHSVEEHLEESTGRPSQDLVAMLHQSLGYLEDLLELISHGNPHAGGGRQSSIGHSGSSPEELLSASNPARALDAAPVIASPSTSRRVEDQAPEQGGPASGGHGPSSSSGEGPIRISAARFDELLDMVSELIAQRRLWASQAESMKTITTLARTCRNRLLTNIDHLHEAGLGREGDGTTLDRGVDVPAQLRRLEEQADDLAVLAETAQAAALPLADHGDALARLTIQLWDELQAIRIIPIRGLFHRLARVAHDAARVEGRQIEVVLVGEEIGLDRAVQDKAFEPLLHVVRNAVGHGIEAPSDRLEAGKPAKGRLTLEARREGNTLAIGIQDDGRGLNYEAIASKARKLGLLSPEETPSIETLHGLIFQSGFSTRQEANTISGRGVGMDVVAREVGLLRGTIDLQSQPKRGTRLTIRLPARLALETTMIVRIDGQAYGLPVSQVEYAQSFEPPPNEDSGQSGYFAAKTVSFREERIPVIQAREMLGLTRTTPPTWPKLLVVRADHGLIGLVIDAIEGTEDLVIKSLGSLLAGHPLISGTSLSVSGEVISILNPSGMARWVGNGPTALPATTGGGSRETQLSATPVLVVDDSISVRRVVARHLRAMGLDVEEVSDGLEALGRLRARPFGLVVTDLEMPKLDGFDLLAEMRRSSPLAATPVVVASTRVDQETRQRVLALGAKALLSKPVDPSELARTVEPLLQGVNC